MNNIKIEETKGNPIAVRKRNPDTISSRRLSSNSNYIITGKELLETQITEPDYLWQPFLQRQDLAILGGSSDVGKSAFLRQFCIAIVNGDDKFLG